MLSRDYPISAIVHDTPLYPQGATTLPGKYTVKLIAEGKTVTQPLEIRMDPRVKTSPEDLRRQFELDRKLASELHRDHEALLQAPAVENSVESSLGTISDREVGGDLDSKAANPGGESGARYLNTPEGRSLARLNGGFASILSGLDCADAAPTTQEIATLEELEKARSTIGRVEPDQNYRPRRLNEQLKKAGLPEIKLSPSSNADSSAAQTTSQDRDNNLE